MNQRRPATAIVSGARAASLLACFAILLAAKVAFSPDPAGTTSDGSFYYQVARHVQDGDGLKTSVSLWNAGLRELPHASHVYPLWPLLLGYSGRVAGLDAAARSLPVLLYFVSLVLLYALVRMATRAQTEHVLVRWRGTAVLDTGHLIVLLFALNPVYFRFSSLPFTEPLLYAFVFGSLLLTCRAVARDQPAIALAAGAAAGMAYLTKSQMIGLMLLIPAATWMRGRRGVLLALAMVAGSAAVVLPWYLYLRGTFGPFPVYALIDFAAYQQTPELAPDEFVRRGPTLSAYLAQRLIGVAAAFSTRPSSYYTSFGAAAFLVPVGVVYAIPIVRHALKAGVRSAAHSAARSARSDFLVWLTALAGGVLLIPAHDAMMPNGAWLFGFRHGLPLILLLVAVTAVLVPAGRVGKAICVVALTAGIGHGALGTWELIAHRNELLIPRAGAAVELAAWIDQQERRPVIAAAQWIASPLGATTRGLYHEIYCQDSREQVLVYFDVLRIDYLLTSPDAEQCPFFQAVKDRIAPAAVFGSGADRLRLWRPVR